MLRSARHFQSRPHISGVINIVQTNFIEAIKHTADGQEAETILRACVHCGFCTATCPTYQLLCNELDSPRGRIYLIKEMLEGAEVK